MKRSLFTGTAWILVTFPLLASAVTNLIPCGTDATGGHLCKFSDIFTLGNNIVKFALVDLAIPLAIITFVAAGLKYILHPTNEGKQKEAKALFWDAFLGFAIALSAYLLIKGLITLAVGSTDSGKAIINIFN